MFVCLSKSLSILRYTHIYEFLIRAIVCVNITVYDCHNFWLDIIEKCWTERMMAQTLTENEIADFRDAFAIFDKDNDGFIKKAEMRDILISLGKDGSEEEVQRVILAADMDGDGLINFPEFLNMMANNLSENQLNEAGELEHMFKIIDRDQDGFITHAEMKRALDEMGDKASDSEVTLMIRKADSDGDGKLTFEDISANLHELSATKSAAW